LATKSNTLAKQFEILGALCNKDTFIPTLTVAIFFALGFSLPSPPDFGRRSGREQKEQKKIQNSEGCRLMGDPRHQGREGRWWGGCCGVNKRDKRRPDGSFWRLQN